VAAAHRDRLGWRPSFSFKGEFKVKKSKDAVDPTPKPLIERQRKLWVASDAIDLANHRKQPLPEDLAKCLFIALRKIAFGEDANKVFDVVPEKRGVHKNGLKLEFETKFAISNIAAATAHPKNKKTKDAISAVSKGLPKLKQTTVRRKYNESATERKPHFSLGKK
jgi:hypothetical protein